MTIYKYISDAARKLFIAKQYADVSLREISEVAGVTKGALYHHFQTKEELYLRTIYDCLNDVKEAVESSLEENRGKSCRERLYLSLVSFLRLPDEKRVIMRSIRQNINIFDEPIRADLIEAYQAALPQPIESLLKEGMKNGEVIKTDARLLSWQHIAVVEVSLHEYGRSVLGGPEEMAESIVNLYFDGVGNPT